MFVFAYCATRLRKWDFRRLFMRLALAVPLFGCTGCISFIDSELNNHGGYLDQRLDERWLVADTKQMRVLRAYSLIGSLAHMTRENYYGSERELIADHVKTAVLVAFEAYACAYSRPGDCIYFDERMAELEIAVIRLAIAVFAKHENQSLITTVVAQASETAPLLQTLTSFAKVADAVTSSAEVVASTTKLIKSLLMFGETAYFAGREAGALYRDSIELGMIATLGSLDIQCEDQKGQLRRTKDAEEWQTLTQFYPGIDNGLDPCGAFEDGLKAWNQGNGDLTAWHTFLATRAYEFRSTIIPGERAFVQASDLIYRACEQISGKDDLILATCLGHRGLKAGTLECGVENKSGKYVRYDSIVRTTEAQFDRAEANILSKDQCRLILFGKAWGSRQRMRGRADARIFALSREKRHNLSYRAREMFNSQ